MGGGSQASTANTKPVASATTNVNNVHNELNVWYTHRDQFLNKIDELKLRIYNADTKPSIIAITEVNPKNNRNPIFISELKIDNFLEPLYNPNGKGICIYLANTIELISTSSTKYHLRAIITIEDNGKLTISCHYRSPNYNEDKNNKCMEDMEYILVQDQSHQFMMGDFNMPHTDRTRMVNTETFVQACINKLNDHFMYQYVTTATQFRINQNTNILDLVLTNEEHMIPDGVTTESPLGASDHSLLSLSFQCYTKRKSKNPTQLLCPIKLTDSMKQDLRQDWDMLFENMTTNQIWSILQNKINTAINKHISQTNSVLTSTAKRKPIWMSYKALTKVKKTHGMAEIHEQT